MKLSLISVEAFADYNMPAEPKMAIVALVKWLEKNDYTKDKYDPGRVKS